MNIKDIYINDAITRICEGSKSVDKLNIKAQNDIIIAAFKADKGYRIVQLTKNEIVERINTENIDNASIKDFIISLIGERLVTGIVIDGVNNIKKDIEKYMTINDTVKNILDMLFPDK